MSNIPERLQSIVGAGNVVEKPDFCSSIIGFKGSGKNLSPDYLVRPSDSDQVQQIVQLANETGNPVITVSSQAPHMKGGARPEVPGSIVLDLSRMNRILRVDKRHRLALIEPGVTWEQLSAELAPHGLRIIQPLLPRRGKSVIASLVDREPMLTPKYQWNMTEPLRSLEIIFGTGERIYSGMGGHRGDTDAAWENGTVPLTNAGPHQFDFMKMVSASQGTFGIVTWASVKLELAATEEMPIYAEGQSIPALSDYLYKVLKFRFGDEVCLLNRKALASILATNAQEVESLESRIAPWTALVNVSWGALRAKEKVTTQVQDVRDIAQETGVVPANSIAGLPAADTTRQILRSGTDQNWKEKAAGHYKEVFFLSTLDAIPRQLEAASHLLDAYGRSLADCAVYIQPLHQGTAMHCEIVIPMQTSEHDSEQMQKLYDELSRKLSASGAFFSRPYGVWADIVYGGNTQHAEMTKKMKGIFDPRNILNPGKLCF